MLPGAEVSLPGEKELSQGLGPASWGLRPGLRILARKEECGTGQSWDNTPAETACGGMTFHLEGWPRGSRLRRQAAPGRWVDTGEPPTLNSGLCSWWITEPRETVFSTFPIFL